MGSSATRVVSSSNAWVMQQMLHELHDSGNEGYGHGSAGENSSIVQRVMMHAANSTGSQVSHSHGHRQYVHGQGLKLPVLSRDLDSTAYLTLVRDASALILFSMVANFLIIYSTCNNRASIHGACVHEKGNSETGAAECGSFGSDRSSAQDVASKNDKQHPCQIRSCAPVGKDFPLGDCCGTDDRGSPQCTVPVNNIGTVSKKRRSQGKEPHHYLHHHHLLEHGASHHQLQGLSNTTCPMDSCTGTPGVMQCAPSGMWTMSHPLSHDVGAAKSAFCSSSSSSNISVKIPQSLALAFQNESLDTQLALMSSARMDAFFR